MQKYRLTPYPDYGIRNKNIAKRIMEINSIILEENCSMFKENTGNYDSKDIISKRIKKIKKDAFSAESTLKLSKFISVIYTNFDLKKKVTDKFSITGDTIMISCVYKGDSTVLSKRSKNLELGQVFLTYSPESTQYIKMPASKTRYVCILLQTDYYLNLLKNEKWIKNDSFYKNVGLKKQISLGQFSLPVGFQLQQIVKDLLACNWHSNTDLQLDFFDLKLKELFLQLHHQNTGADHDTNYTVSRTSMEKLKKARAFLMANYKNPPTIKALSRIILLNEVELKKGFKEVFGKTIRAYIIELRMNSASQLIKDHSVNEAAGILGYKSVPHFIKSFKKYYGVTPKQF